MIAQLSGLYIKTRPRKALTRLLSYAFFEGRPLTTKGRWINPLVFSLFTFWEKLPQLKKVEKPIFILGTGRSGTTILGVVLSMHRDVGFLNEPKAFWHHLCPHEDLVGNYTAGPATYRLGEDDITDGLIRKAHRIYGAYLAATFAVRVVDKYPELIFRVPFVQAIFPDAKFIFLVRNGWDTCASIDKWSKRLGTSRGGEVQDWWGINNRKWNIFLSEVVAGSGDLKSVYDDVKSVTSHTDMAAMEWILTMQEGLKLMNDLPGVVHMVRYEELTSSPEETLMKITDFCELPEDRAFLNFAGQALSPARSRPPFKLHPAMEPAFSKTMRQLGYPAA